MDDLEKLGGPVVVDPQEFKKQADVLAGSNEAASQPAKPAIDPAAFKQAAEAMAPNPPPLDPNAPKQTPAAPDLPNVNELFPADKPDVNDLFPIDKDAERYQKFGGSPIQDLIFGDASVNPAARILDAIGQGAKSQWGALTADHVADETKLYLQANKQFDEWTKSSDTITKAANEALFRPIVMGLVKEAIDATAVVHGVQSVFAGGMAGIGQLGKEVGDPELEGQVGAMMDAFPTGPTHYLGMGFGHVPAHPALKGIADLEAEIEKGRQLKVANEDEFMGTAVSPPVKPADAPKPPPAGPIRMPVDLFETPRVPSSEAATTPAEPTVAAPPHPIAVDVAGKLVAAGRPADEAAAAGEIASALHHTRAARFQGAVGTAEDSYNEVGADIRGANPQLPGGERLLPPQAKPEGGAPVEPTPAPQPTASGAAAAEVAKPKVAEHTPLEDVKAADAKVQAEAATVETAKKEAAKPAPGATPKPPEEIAKAKATEASATWDELAKQRQERNAVKPIATGFNDDRNRAGNAKIRAKRSQVWEPGNTVDVGLVKDVLITEKKADGSYTLVSKPDASGMSREYEVKPHEGITRSPNDVDFVKVAEPLKPKPLADVTESGEPIKTVNVKKVPRGRKAADPRTWNLFEYLVDKGGLKADPELHAIFGNKKGPMIGGWGPLLRKKGMTLDQALIAAKEGHYIHDPADITGNEGTVTINDLLDLIDQHHRGHKVYRNDFQPEVAHDAASERGAILDHLHQELNRPEHGEAPYVSPEIEDRVVEIIQKEGGTDVLKAYEAARMEEADRFNGVLHDRHTEIGLAEGWDHPNGESAFAHGEDFAEERGPTRLPVEEPRGGDGEGTRASGEDDRGPLNEGEGDRGAVELTYDQIKRGQIKLRDGFRAVITLFKDANASTFIHETGHHWLAQLMQDALHPKAPADLKADAKTVMNWLNVESPKDIKTAHHEKFARGFERYMMEGKAPSQGLAKVFAQFKTWLVKLYGSVAKLKSPITDDIRGVFDRMLSMPGEIKIEPDEAPHTFADVHEADAAATPPQMAHPTAETAQGERDTVAGATLPKEANDTRLEGTPKQGEGRSPGNQESRGDAVGPEARGDQGNAAPSGTVGEGGIGAAPEGDTTPAGAGRAQEVAPPPARPPVTQDPQTPHDPFPDKAGNIVLKNLNTPEDLNAILRQSAEDNGDYQHVRGPISDSQVMDLAEAAGMDPALIDMAKLSQKWDAPQIVALRRLLIQSSQSVRDLAAKAATGTDADAIAYGEATARHRIIQEAVSGVTSHAGRNLRAFQARFTAGVADTLHLAPVEGTQTLFQLQQEAKFVSKLQTPGQVSKFVNDTTGHKFRSAVLEYYVNALLSGPVTHTRYIVSNAVNSLWTPLVEIPYAAAVGKIAEIAAGKPIERVRIGETGAQLYAMIKGTRDGYYAAIEAYTSGVSPALPTERVSAQFADATRAIPGPIGSAIRVPAKSVAGIHSFFKSLRYEQNIAGAAYRIASNEGLTGKAFTDRVADLAATPSEAMMRDATSNALRELYMSPTDYHSSMGGITRAVNNNLAAKIIVPFLKIGSQITRSALVDKSILGLASPKVRATLRAGGPDAQFQAARIAAGTSLVGATLGLCLEGMMTGDGPDDPKERSTWLLAHKPNTITIGDITVPYANTGPLGMLMRTTANMYELAHGADDKGLGAVAAGLLPALAKSVLDETFLRGFKDLLDAVFHFKEYGGRYATSMITNWIPGSVGLSQVTRSFVDPYQRETAGFLAHPMTALKEAAMAKVPWLSESLMPRRDMFGEPIPNGGPNPDYANDPVVKAMDALHVGIGKMAKKINGIELTEQQYDDVSRIAGRDAKMRLNNMVSIIGNPLVPIGIRMDMIHKEISTARRNARKAIMMSSVGSDNDIWKQSIEAKTLHNTAVAPAEATSADDE